jgi:hypothetical protein
MLRLAVLRAMFDGGPEVEWPDEEQKNHYLRLM